MVMKTKPNKPRNLHAVNAWNRVAAGPITSKRKEQSKQECRQFKHKEEQC
jgi:hypothetical protein